MTALHNSVEWYKDQVVFLTGATGNLGGCLLYKLAVQLPTKKIYVLCRGGMRDAINKWEASMPEQIDDILDTGKIQCLVGDITRPSLGLGTAELEALQKEVTVVIHSAANFSLFQDLPESIRDNCVPVVDLARLSISFQKLKAFLHISTISSKSFLPGGTVLEDAENLSPDEDPPEKQLEEVLSTGKSPYTKQFIAPYGQSKYLAEQILLSLDTPFPVLIVRPTNIGPAIKDPCPFYGPDGAIPLHTFFELLFEASERRKFEDLATLPQDIIVDEIPVDIVANVCLLHLAIGTIGIVQAGSQLYVPVTFGEYMNQIQKYAPPSLVEKAGRIRVEKNVHFANQANDMIQHICRDWQIDCERSKPFKSMEGPIGLALPGHDFEVFFQRRIAKRARNVEKWIDSLKQT
ncbi:male sterility protein-domain-containing protein [Penicillium argentinense]|uniref:Fatty acyl-CoA reductase n=1 Tax=Penicillium argentinense TaxID=1131581 RepID=A0A9W9G524_9EURO|nr:male sterility protein-domain-containing protein [Penicillium argentinense]KAJ5112159.1 male sterility protein-domain-containing protein [Penicillium argentinense]